MLLIKSQVLELQLREENLVDRAVELTTGNESQLTKLIQSGDVSRAVQLASAAILAVDEEKKARSVTQERLKEKRKEVILSFRHSPVYLSHDMLSSVTQVSIA